MLSTLSQTSLPSHPLYPNHYPHITLQTNQYRVSLPEAQKVFLYTVSFFPSVPPDNSRLKKQLIRGCRPDLSRHLGHFIHCGENIYSSKDVFQEANISPREDESTSSVSNEYLKVTFTLNEVNYEVTLIPSGDVDFSDHSKLSSVMQICNISLRHKLKLLKFVQLGSMRNHYDPENFKTLNGFPACLWPGFFTSVNLLRDGLMLTIDCSFKLVRTDSLLEVIDELMQKCRNSRELVRRELENKIVITVYGSQNTYRVEDVLFDERPTDKFLYGSSTITYMKYFKDRYQAQITHTSQPLILARRNLRSECIKLVPELCRMTGAGSLADNFKLKKEISTYTRMRPDKRMKEIQSLASILNVVSDSQLEITNELVPVTVEAHQLPHPRIQTVQKSLQITEKSSFNLRECKPVKSVPLDKWQVFFFERDQGICQDFVKGMKGVSAAFSQVIREPLMVPVRPARDVIGSLCAVIREKARAEAQLVVVILPKNLQHGYKEVKKVLTTEKPISSQVVMTSSIERGDPSVYSKILIQVLCKIGGTPWTVTLPSAIPARTMLVGIDVCHNSFTAKQSVLGFCASLDPHFTKFYSKAAIHAVGQEISTVLTPIFFESLKAFYSTNNKTKPDCIVIYRDGVGTSQYDEVVHKEVPQLVEAIKTFDKTWKPQIVVLVVNKRVNQRFLMNGQNPGPGIVVDSSVVWDHYNFYLMSHAVNMGCMTPTHYNVVVNESNIATPTLYELTYNLCYLYFNWQGGIRVPSPCMYAHKIAYLVGKHTGLVFDASLNRSFFYL